MNRNVFVGGPISNLIKENGFDEAFFSMHKRIVDELCQFGFQVFSAHVVEEYGRNKIEPDNVIVERDLRWIDDADVCIFLFPSYQHQSIRTDGTYIELGYATSRCGRVICFWDSDNATAYSPMFRGMTSRKVEMFDFDKIREVLGNLE